MVDALRQVHRMVTPEGVVVDIHPTADAAVILGGDTVAGAVESVLGSARHQAATDALAAARREGLYRLEDTAEFEFHTYAGTVEDLRDFILANWRDTHIAEATVENGRRLAAAGGRIHARERVVISRLRPLSK